MKIRDDQGREVAVADLLPKEMSTGSLGWSSINKVQIKTGDTTVWVQLNIVGTVIGSKDLPRDEPAEPAA